MENTTTLPPTAKPSSFIAPAISPAVSTAARKRKLLDQLHQTILTPK